MALDNSGLGIKVLDAREADEHEIAKADGVPLLSLSQIESRFTELDPNQTYDLHCKPGVRSLKARTSCDGFRDLQRRQALSDRSCSQYKIPNSSAPPHQFKTGKHVESKWKGERGVLRKSNKDIAYQHARAERI